MDIAGPGGGVGDGERPTYSRLSLGLRTRVPEELGIVTSWTWIGMHTSECAILTMFFGRRDAWYLLDTRYVCAIPNAIGSEAKRDRVRRGIIAGLKW